MTQSPASALLEAVCAHHRAQDRLNFLTDSESYPDKVLLAIWQPAAAYVIAIAKSEWDGLATAKLFGFEHVPKPAIERAKEKKHG